MSAFPSGAREDQTCLESLRPLPTTAPVAGKAGSASEAVPDRIGVYKILSEIGRGGMGRVYKAVQTDLGRTVALKTLPLQPNLHEDVRNELIERFSREVSMTSRLRHPGIIPVFDFGQEGDIRYFTMPYIEGHSLSGIIAQKGKLTPRAAFELVAPLAQALAHAHSRGVIHRDIKPNNVLVDSENNPILLDFGLVKIATGPTDLTTAGMILGTPQYMSPEQASGFPELVDEQSDIYSLGAVLYYLLTGRPPFDGRSVIDVFTRIANQPVPDPTEFNPDIDPAAREICLKALAKDKGVRYGKASQFARDATRYLKGRPVKAGRTGVIVRMRRSPRLLGGIAVLIAAATLAAAMFVAPARPRPGRLSLGVAPFEDRARVEKAYIAFAAHLGRALECDVEPVLASSYDDVFERVTSGRIDLAVLPPYNYVRAKERADVQILATFSANGQTHYYGAIVVREDSGIEDLEDLQGRRFGYTNKSSASGYVFPRYLLLSRGIDPDSFLAPEPRYFQDHARLRQAVRDGVVEAGATYLSDDLVSPLRVLARTDPIPYDAFVARPGLDPELRQRVGDALRAISPADATGQALASLYSGFDGWRAATDADFNFMRQFVRLKSERALIAVVADGAAPGDDVARLRRRLSSVPQCHYQSEADLLERLHDRKRLERLRPTESHLSAFLADAGLDWLVFVSGQDAMLWRRNGPVAEQVRIFECAGLSDPDRLERLTRSIVASIPRYGFVLDAKDDRVEVNLGSHDGLAPGQTLIVFQYEVRQDPLTGGVTQVEVDVGRLEVVSTAGESSTCRAIEGQGSGQGSIGYGRRVRTPTPAGDDSK